MESRSENDNKASPMSLNLLPKPVKSVAYIDENSGSSSVLVDEVLSMQVPKHIRYGEIYPVYAPSGSMIDRIPIRKHGGYQPGSIYMRKLTEKDLPYSMKEQRLKHTIDMILRRQAAVEDVENRVTKKSRLVNSVDTEGIFKSTTQSVHDLDQNERKEYLGRFNETDTHSDANERSEDAILLSNENQKKQQIRDGLNKKQKRKKPKGRVTRCY